MAITQAFRIVRPGADVTLTLQVYFEDGQYVCGLRFLEGRIDLGPKALRAAMTEELAKIENVLREAGITEIRHAGEDRAWFLPGYEPMPDKPQLRNGRRKRLTNG